MRLVATVAGMGAEVEHDPLDPDDGYAYVLLKMKVEDARELAPGLGRPVGLEMMLKEVPGEED